MLEWQKILLDKISGVIADEIDVENIAQKVEYLNKYVSNRQKRIANKS